MSSSAEPSQERSGSQVPANHAATPRSDQATAEPLSFADASSGRYSVAIRDQTKVL